jgi:hypothetical protein
MLGFFETATAQLPQNGEAGTELAGKMPILKAALCFPVIRRIKAPL